jgi:hypothetical protein
LERERGMFWMFGPLVKNGSVLIGRTMNLDECRGAYQG